VSLGVSLFLLPGPYTIVVPAGKSIGFRIEGNNQGSESGGTAVSVGWLVVGWWLVVVGVVAGGWWLVTCWLLVGYLLVTCCLVVGGLLREWWY
jgi:hypothetical protein